MNKSEAMKLMIDGKKIIDKNRNQLHYYTFKDGRFKYVKSDGSEVFADMPEHNDYEVFTVRKTITVHGFTTPAFLELLKDKSYDRGQMTFTTEKTRFSYSPVRILFEVEEA